MDVSSNERFVYAFGRYRLDPVTRSLLQDGAPAGLPPRLFDTLLHLVANAERVVGHEELLREVWRGRAVEGANIKQTIFALRRALRDGSGTERMIVTVPTHGYRFAATVTAEPVEAAPLAAIATHKRPRASRAGVVTWCVAVVAVLALVAAWRLSAPVAPGDFGPPNSIAVLPFGNLTGDAAQSYLSDGIAEEMTGALGRIGTLHVAARTSAFALRDSKVIAGDIGRRLHVASLLEGSVRRAGERVRITASLIDTSSGYTLWTADYDRTTGDMLQTQTEIATKIAETLQVTLLGGDAGRLMAGGTANGAAFDAYLHGTKLANSAGDTAGLRLAVLSFDRAIAADPSFALARARRAQALLVVANSDSTSDVALVRERLDHTIAEARNAVRLAPNLGLAHLALGAALMSVQDFAAADREIALAHNLAPGDAQITLAFALAQVQFGRPDAAARAAEQAAASDPLTAGTYDTLASILLAAHRDDEAQAALRRARILGDIHGADALEVAIALDRHDYASALNHCDRGSAWRATLCRALALHGMGRGDEAASQYMALHTMLGDNGAFQYAELYAQWNQPDVALRWLDTAYRLHDTGLVMMKSDPLLAPIRGTRQYADVERRLNFPTP